jgi:hypothetical protein
MRLRVRARLLLTSVCTVCTLALPASALASGSPVHVDPSSPVAKEYALPLATARGAPPESGQSGKLFGSGIKHTSSTVAQTTTQVVTTPPPPPPPPPTEQQVTPITTASTTTPTSPPRPPVRRHPPHVTTVTLPVLTTPGTTKRLTAKATPAAYRVLKPGSGSGLLWMVVAAVLVLALGSAGGLALSRRR